ncbi:MAG: 1-(5-phosphoribosyl)-5-[(5-phosphoribosylamino)methylideneamino]imidazole-4-carboxamide isomerase [Planctomycetota bacterium]|jgi:phosphoribosylformimino-5-aminoimidazole carboxamide ribotide isomerase|nr:1-(5-phosphoribosyl)-5-[(5-phosphoribosylamino)methylideneamino]imidazole-4-carboxamide isomerase [Pirellulaceae bacterium]MEC7499315.1 1-(5-phosphoribosyl)-5-[(5-phosphoribosylamino)methylideneamino]imidazole-4-carboxamide isomerase [Planctomycetota bacterium]MDP7377591.1 1-(5-phosphoribosyl)-5-[(5-phosphoribosylamino)methylideneamino]imidazole-4-carboxamide isomerase [Pirellulaceae bacterium]MEC7604183.1 1-(5-phosphoribosyl)-5-[(5-phosphoribosylamino)methylideneamino]imidazole-4-carboxamide
MKIWPAVDIRGGQCVRLIQGDYDQETVYGANPADMAIRWASDGAGQIHLVDLDGARDGSTANRQAVAEIVNSVEVPCQLGGGIRDRVTVAEYLGLGVERLVIGTKAQKDPDWLSAICKEFPERIVIGLDARSGMVATDGWLQTSDTPASELAKRYSKLPIAGIVYTDITRDGMLKGPNLEALKDIIDAVDVPVIASGGVTTSEDVTEIAKLGAAGCIIGRSLYEGKMTLADAMDAVVEANA